MKRSKVDQIYSFQFVVAAETLTGTELSSKCELICLEMMLKLGLNQSAEAFNKASRKF